ncbi:MAG TPA: DUF1365 domain-containing protein [Telluria sp.]
MNSAIYFGQVRHRRLAPVEHGFTYRMFMLYLDLAELPRVFRGRWLWSARRSALARFHRADHFGDPQRPLDDCVRDLVARETGVRPAGPIRLLTHLRYFGYVFNPVSFYYCFAADDTRVETVVAEVTNTPWGERHCYVLPQSADEGQGGHGRYRPAKAMHVSPFMPMDVDYDWRFGAPVSDAGSRLSVHMENARGGSKIFDATLLLERAEITTGSLARALALYPFMTLKVIAAIHWQALKLWLKGARVYDHPAKNRRELEEAR